MAKAKAPRKTKDVEIAEFRAEVVKYLNTGISAILTTKEKSMLDKVRVPSQACSPSILDRFLGFLKK